MNRVHTTRSSCYRKLLETQKQGNRLKVACWSSWGKSRFLTEILLMSFERVTALGEVLQMAIGFVSEVEQQTSRQDLIRALLSTVPAWGGRGAVPITAQQHGPRCNIFIHRQHLLSQRLPRVRKLSSSLCFVVSKSAAGPQVAAQSCTTPLINLFFLGFFFSLFFFFPFYLFSGLKWTSRHEEDLKIFSTYRI